MSYLIYNLLLVITFCISLPMLPLMLLFGKRFRGGFWQRFGFYPKRLGGGFTEHAPIWIHAASVGEARAAKILIDALRTRFPERRIVLSTFTQTGNEVALQRADGEEVVYLPLDLVWTVRRSLSTLNPAVLILVETEIWPNVVREAHRRGIPVLLISGRISPRAFYRYSRLRWLFCEAIQNFTVFGMQSEADRARIISLGADPRKVLITGNLKQAASVARALKMGEEGASSSKTASVEDRRGEFLWVVGSSHPGEEEIVLAAFEYLRKHFPALRMVLAPRHPHRFREVEKLLLARGLRFEKKSELNGKLCPDKDVLIVDTMGDLESLYAAGDIAFVGGSLVDAGGHNLLEPARFRKPVLFGPYTSNVAVLAQELMESGGGIQVRDCDDLVREITVLLAKPERCRAVGARAFQVAARDHSVLDGSVDIIARCLEA